MSFFIWNPVPKIARILRYLENWNEKENRSVGAVWRRIGACYDAHIVRKCLLYCLVMISGPFVIPDLIIWPMVVPLVMKYCVGPMEPAEPSGGHQRVPELENIHPFCDSGGLYHHSLVDRHRGPTLSCLTPESEMSAGGRIIKSGIICSFQYDNKSM